MKKLIKNSFPFITYGIITYALIMEIIHLLKIKNTAGLEIKYLLCYAIAQFLFTISTILEKHRKVFLYLSFMVLILDLTLIYIYYKLK